MKKSDYAMKNKKIIDLKLKYRLRHLPSSIIIGFVSILYGPQIIGVDVTNDIVMDLIMPSLITFCFLFFFYHFFRFHHYSDERLKEKKLYDDLNLIADIFNMCDSSLFIKINHPSCDGSVSDDYVKLYNETKGYIEIPSDNHITIRTCYDYLDVELGSNTDTYNYSCFWIAKKKRKMGDSIIEIPLKEISQISFNDWHKGWRDNWQTKYIYVCSKCSSLSEFIQPVLRQNGINVLIPTEDNE